jgi:hypothetical protein
MTTIQFAFTSEDGFTVNVTILEVDAAKAAQQVHVFTAAWLKSQAAEAETECEECKTIMDLPDADFSGEKN